MPKKRLRDVVIVLPGITGSVLQKNERDIWAISGQAAWQALTSLGGSLRDLVLNNDDPNALDLGDGVRATRLIPDAHLVPGLVKIDGYSETLRAIENNFEVRRGGPDDEQPANLIEFPYDWRRDNRASARRLEQVIKRKLPLWRSSSGALDAKVILIGHSMGGLVSRYYAEVLEGWRDCRALITFGTPYRGSVNAVGFLANGYKQLFLDLTEVLRSFTSVYQLLPIYKVVRVGGTYQRIAETDGIPGVVRARAEQALAFHREIEQAVTEHRKDIEYRDNFVTVPVIGTRQPTLQSATLPGGQLSVSRDLPDGIDPLLGDGDGTVPRLSATPIELSLEYRDSFFPERHGSLQRNTAVLADLLGRIEQMQVTGLGAIRGAVQRGRPEPSPGAAEQPAISLDLDDLYIAGEPVSLRASLINATPAAGMPVARIQPVDASGEAPGVVAVSLPQVAGELPFRDMGDHWGLTIEGLPAGLYRVSVHTTMAGPGTPMPVHDLFEVAG